MHVSRTQSRVPTYSIENVPNSAKFHDIIQSLGAPVIVEAQLLGSSALRKTTIWTNATDNTNLMANYRTSQINGKKVPEFLIRSGFVDWVPTPSTLDYFPKFMSRFGSWAYSFTADGGPGPGMLLHNDVLQEPSPDIKEMAMGYPRGSTAAGGVNPSMRHKVMGACMDHNIARWLLPAARQPDKHHTSERPTAYINYQHNSHTFPDQWIVDGGATSHFSGHESDFISLEPIPPKLVKGMNLHAIAIYRHSPNTNNCNLEGRSISSRMQHQAAACSTRSRNDAARRYSDSPVKSACITSCTGTTQPSIHRSSRILSDRHGRLLHPARPIGIPKFDHVAHPHSPH